MVLDSGPILNIKAESRFVEEENLRVMDKDLLSAGVVSACVRSTFSHLDLLRMSIQPKQAFLLFVLSPPNPEDGKACTADLGSADPSDHSPESTAGAQRQ